MSYTRGDVRRVGDVCGNAAAPGGLDVHDLVVESSNGGVVVVDEISFSVASGDVLGLVGESGSGKTTVALALLGYARRGLRIAAGRVILGGRDVLAASPAELQRLRGSEIAYVPQDPASALNPVLRIGRQVAEAIRIHPGSSDDPAARVAEVFNEVGLSPDPATLRRFPHQLSGGQQQRVVLAIAFACRPSVIVLDEPTTGLDVTTQRRVLQTVRNLCAAYGVAGVYVSHDLAVVDEIATEVAVFYAGRIVELGPTAKIFGTPIHPYTRGLIASVPSTRQRGALRGIPGQHPRPGRRSSGCSFGPRCELRQEACTERPPDPVRLDGRTVRCFRAQESRMLGPVKAHEVADVPSTGAPKLIVRDLDAFYGSNQVLAGINLEVCREQCVAIVGESGAGKTTLAQCIVGLHQHWTGELLFDGAPLAAQAKRRNSAVLRQVQYVFQNPYLSLNPKKTIAQVVGEPLRQFFSSRGADADRQVKKVLDDVSLGTDYLDRYPDQLSGGERQRVAIARALVVRPELLVCDEVTSALDVSVQAVIVELLRRLQREHHLSMLFITHNLALVQSVADTCIVLSAGRVVEIGSVADVLERPTHPYTAQLVADIPQITADPTSFTTGSEKLVRSISDGGQT